MTKTLQFLLSFTLFITSITLQAQSWNLANGTQNMCAGTFLDPAGAGNYGNNQNVTGTICAATPGQCLVVTFTSFNLHAGSNGSGVDYLYVYDGNSTAAPASSIMTGAATPGAITSSTGCLTFQFVTDGANVSSGWAANISCTNCSADATTPACPSVNAGPDQNVCSGQCVTLSATAASSGGTQSYTVVNIPYTPQSFTSGTNQLVDTDDIWGNVLNIGFNFCYYGSTYSQIVIGANGCITFNTASAGAYNEWSTTAPFPNPLNHTNQICAPYHDIDPSVGFDPNRIKFEVTGAAPCRVAKISWNNIPMFSCNNLLATQQILLYETTNVIETHIANKPTCAGWNSGEAIHGIENQNGTIATVVPGRNYPTQWNVTNDGKRFIPAGASTYTIAWYQGATQIGTGPTLQVCPTATTTYTSRVVYTKCDGSTVTVTDNVTVNITSTITANITQTQPFTCTTAQVPLSVTVNPPAVYTYTWAPVANIVSGAGTSTVNVNSSGTYTVTVTNAANCQATATINVQPANPPTASASPSPNTACAAPFNGSVSVSTTGFAVAPAPTYVWSNGATTQNLNNVAAGNYTVTVTQGSCNVTATATVANNAVVTASASSTPNTACAAPFNGSANASGTGFSGTPNYSWSGPGGFTATTQAINNIAPGTYNVTITQGTCSATATTTVANNSAVTASASSTPNTLCAAPFNGSASASGTGFAGVPTYAWSNGATTQAINNIAPGNYTVTITQGGCSATATTTVANNSAVTASASSTPNTTCAAPFNGSASASGTGFAGVPTYAWSNGATTQAINNIAPGNYTVTITQGGCSATATTTVANNPALATASINGLGSACTTDPAPQWVASGGGTYLWSPGGATTAAITPTVGAPGTTTYTVTVTAPNGCTAVATQDFTVNVCACPNPVTVLITNTNLSLCSSQNTIDLTSTITGSPTLTWSSSGSGSFSSTSNPNPTYTFSAADIASGSVTITVNTNDPDGAGIACQPATDNITLNIITPTASASSTPNTACAAPYNGSVSLSTSGFTNPTYSWSGPNGFTSGSQNLSNVANGTYNVTVTDANCTATATATVTNTINLTATASPTDNSTCSMPFNGSISLTTSGFTNPTYSWSGPNGFTSIDQNLTGLQGTSAGSVYTVTVTDGACSTTATATVINTAVVSATASPTPNTACGVPYNGNITLSTSGFGNPTYSWSGPNGFTASSQNLNNVNEGTYTVTITEGACTATATATVINDINLSVTPVPTPNTTCGTPYTGSVSLTTSGFTAPTYAWSGPDGFTSTDQNLNNINGGTYTVTVTEGSCVETATVTVDNNATPDVIAIPIPNTQCVQPYVGSITLNLSGFGTPTVAWSGPSGFTSAATNLTGVAPGDYTVTVTEGNCSVTTTATIDNNISPPTAFLAPTPNIACDPLQYDGAIDLSTNGDQFLWSNGATTEDINGLASGDYTVTVTNSASNCTTTASVTVDEMSMAPDLFVFGPITITCNSVDGQEMLLGSTGTAGVQFQWETTDGNIVSGADTETPMVDAAGTYTVTISAPGGCTNNGVTTVVVAPPPSTTITGPNTACSGGIISLSASPGYEQYLWSTGATTQTITDTLTASTSYTVTVADGFSCTATASLNVAVNPPPTPAITGSLTFCQNGNTTLDAGGGYSSYLWTGGATTQTLLVTAAGNYCVTVTDANSCSGTACVAVAVNSVLMPNVVGGDFCEGSSVDLDAGLGFVDYQWSNGNTGQIITVNTVGTYTVTVSDATGCSGTGSVAVNQNPNPTPIINGDPTICEGTTTTLNPGAYSSYVWSDGSFGATLSVGAGTYSVTVTDANGCTGSDEIVIVETPNPVPIITGNVPFCVGDNITLDAGAGFSSYAWSIGGNGQTLVASNAGSYSVVVTDANGCTGTDAVMLVTNNLPIPTISGDLGICPTESTTLTATPGFDAYLWSNGNVEDNITTTIAGQYIVTVTDSNNCNGTATVTVLQNNAAVPTIAGDNEICLGQNTSLNAGSYAQYAWLPDGQTSQNINITPSSNTSYSVTVTDNDGCTASNSLNVTVHELPIVEIGGSTTFCEGSNLFLSATFGFSNYEWNPAVGNVSDVVINTGGTYSVTITDNNGCTASDNIIVTQSNSLNPLITGDLNICSGESTTLSAGTFDNYQWSANAGSVTTATITVTTAGNYCVTVSDASGCSGTRCATVVVNANPMPNITGLPSICPGSTSTLNPGAYTDYIWQDGSFSATYTATAAGTYSVTVTDSNGCTATDDFTVSLNANLSPTITGDASFCNGSSGQLDAGAGYATYVWSTSATTQSINVNTAGTYSVTVADSGGCSGTDSFDVTVNANPNPNITGDLAICNGQSTTLTASGGTSYIWDNGAGNAATANVSPSTNTTYTVTATDANGCSGTASTTVVVNTAAAPILNGDTDLCNGDCTTLNVAGSYTNYIWSSGQTNANINVCPTANATYSVTVTDANGCTNSGTINVNVYSNPTPSIGGSTTFCAGGSTTLDAGSHDAYIWSNGSNTQTINVSIGGNYCVTVTDANGCTGSTCVDVSESSQLNPVITGDPEICAGATTTLNPGTFAQYQWSANAGNATTQTINVTTSGSYCVTVTDNGCSGTACFDVLVNPNPTPVIDGITALCAGTPTTLDAGSYTGYEWSANAGGVFTQTISVSASGTYSVTVTDANGCSGTDDVAVNITPNPTPSITGDLAICSGETTSLDAGAYADYIWSPNGETAQTINVSVGGTYNVTVTDSNGCIGTDSAIVNESIPVTPNITGDTDICNGTSTTLNAGSFASYDWSPGGQNTQSITVSPTGNATYSVSVTDANGCTSSNEINVIVNPLPEPQISGSLTYCTGSATTLSASPGFGYVWSGGETTESISVSTPGTYCITVSDVITTCTASVCVDVSEDSELNPQISGDLEICAGETTTLDAGVFSGIYTWSPNGENTQTISVSNAGTYCVTVSDVGGCTGSACVDVVVNANPTPTITGPASICAAGSATLDAGTYVSYEWSPNANSSFNQTVSVSAQDTYTVTVTDNNGCVGTDSFALSISANLTPTITGGTDVCLGSSTVLDAGAGYDTYTWLPAGTGNTQTVTVSPNVNTMYSVTVTDASGCSGTADITVNINSSLTPTITGGTDVCLGSSTVLDAGAGYDTYTWLPAGTGNTQTVTVSPSVNTMYSVTVTDASGCSGTADITVNINSSLTPTITGDTEICAGQSTTLDAGTYDNYTWSPAGTGSTQTVTVSPNADATYTVTVSDASGCSGTATIDVVVNANPTPTITGDFTICQGESTDLDAGTYDNYTWLPAGTGSTQVVTVTPASNTTYNVTVTDANGCVGTTSAAVTVTSCNCIAPAAPTLTVNSAAICEGETNTTAFVATAVPNTSIVWYDGPDNNTATQLGTGLSYTLVSNTTTTVYAFTLNAPDDGCISAGIPATLTVYPNPVAALTTTPDGLCVGESSNIAFSGTASASAIYFWNFGLGATPAIASGAGPHSVSWATSGVKNVSLSISDTGGCVDNATNNVSVSSMTVSIDSTASVIDQGSSVVLTATGISGLDGDISYVWTPAGTLSCSDCAAPNATPTETTTTYTVTAIDEYGCEALATAVINTIYKKAVIIPNAFSPNGDNDNDLFRPRGLNIESVYLEIRNRWGNKLYAEDITNLNTEGWDGTFDGKDCDVAVYVYYVSVKFTDGSEEFLKGNVTLVR